MNTFKTNKLSIGTAQFGFNYGITNLSGKVPLLQIKKILNFSRRNQILNIDTAIDYKKSETELGKCRLEKFKITTKIPPIPKKQKNIYKWIKNKIEYSLKKLNLNKIYAVLLHKPSQLNTNNGEDIYKALLQLKKEKYFTKFGVSVYSVGELNNILKKYKINIVNIPLSIANKSFLKKNYLKKLKNNNIEIHVRSIFLQGLLVNYKLSKVNFLLKENFFQKYDKWLKKNRISPVYACINFVKEIKEIDKIIVGIDNFNQLKDIHYEFNTKKKINYPNFNFKKKISNPQFWKN